MRPFLVLSYGFLVFFGAKKRVLGILLVPKRLFWTEKVSKGIKRYRKIYFLYLLTVSTSFAFSSAGRKVASAA